MLPSNHERGSAALEFILVSVPLIFITVSIAALFGSMYAMNVLRDSVVEGSRFAALADQSSVNGCERAQLLLVKGLGKALEFKVDCFAEESPLGVTEKVAASVYLSIPGLLPQSRWLSAESSSPRETF